MKSKTLEEKLAQYHEFFAIEHHFTVNITPIDNTNELTFEQFTTNMPMPFKLASDVKTIDQTALRPLQGLSGTASQLVDFLNHQSQKIDLLIGYILSQQEDEKQRYPGKSFGGGGVTFTANCAFNIGQLLEMKVFLLEESCAVYCYGEVIEASSVGDEIHHKVIFHFIREEDREALVRTSLHKQSKQLQKLANQRNKELKHTNE